MTQLQRQAAGFQLEDRGELTLLTVARVGAASYKNAYGRAQSETLVQLQLQQRQSESGAG